MAPALRSVASVKALVPRPIFERGREIAASAHRLQDAKFEGPGMESAIAFCAGSNEGEMYRLSILINAEQTSNPKCECSCPAAAKHKGGLCKHLIALLLLRIKELTKHSQSSADGKNEAPEGVEGVSQTATSDSQLTEPWVESEVPTFVENIPVAPTSSTSRNVGEGRNRTLPAWMLGKVLPSVAVGTQKRGPSSKEKSCGYVNDDGERDEEHRRGIARANASNKRKISTVRGRKRLKIEAKDASDEDIGELEEDVGFQGSMRRKDHDLIDGDLKCNCNNDDDIVSNEQQKTCQNSVGIEKSNKRASKGESLSRKTRKSSRWLQTDSDLSDEDTDIDNETGQDQINSVSGREISGGTTIKRRVSVSKVVGKSKKKGLLSEEDCMEEDAHEPDYEFGTTVSHDSSEFGLALTTEDLVSMARKHLEEAEESMLKDAGDSCQQDSCKEKKKPKKEDSIFSVREWKAISTVNLNTEDCENKRAIEREKLLNIENMDIDRKCNDGGDGSVEVSLLNRSEERRDKSPQTADNVAEDMLNLLFGPSFCVAASLGNTYKSQNEMTVNPLLADVPEQLNSNLNPHIHIEALKPKKKGSLKDKVMMFLS